MCLSKTHFKNSRIFKIPLSFSYCNRKLKITEVSMLQISIFFFIWGSRKFPRFLSFRFWPLYWNWKLGKLGIFTTLENSKECVLLDEVGNFRGFRVFSFGCYTEIENSEPLQIFSRHLSFKKCVLFEEVGNFRGFRVFDFGSYTEIEKSENSEIFPRHVNSKECVLPEEVENFRDFWVFNFSPYNEIENSEN